MRVAFAGASGTGKTTLAKFVAEVFGLEMNPIGSRQVAKAMGFDSPYDVDKAGRRTKFQVRLLKEKVEWEASRNDFVSDRTVFDNLAYTMLHGVDSIDNATMDVTCNAGQRYTHIIVCPVEAFHDLGNDEVRKPSFVYHVLYEVALRGLIQRYADPDKIEVLNVRSLERRHKRLSRLLSSTGE
jgi:cytidylate kinase